jgi:lipoate-protein ligase A
VKLTLTAIFDEDVRKQVRDEIMGECRKIARSVFDDKITAEMTRLGATLVSKFTKDEFLKTTKKAIREMLKESFYWDGIKDEITEAIEEAATKNINAKLANKTVWEAKEQDAYVRKVVQQELKKIFAAGAKD